MVVPWLGGIKSRTTAADDGARDPFGGITFAIDRQLGALSAAQQDVVSEGLSKATLCALVQQLNMTGLVLSSISIPHLCNNSTCDNLSGLTDVRLVLGRINTVCGGCRIARYCGKACQHQAWPQHRRSCKALAAAAAAAAAAASDAAAADVQV
jgi:hypothetical protein